MHPIFSDIFKQQFPALPWKSEESATQVQGPNEVSQSSEGSLTRAQENQLCKTAGFPTIEEQQNYWKKREVMEE